MTWPRQISGFLWQMQPNNLHQGDQAEEEEGSDKTQGMLLQNKTQTMNKGLFYIFRERERAIEENSWRGADFW